MNTFITDPKTTIIILCTLPNNKSVSLKIMRALLTLKLAACITLLQETYSCYYWNDVFETQTEHQILIKTRYDLQELVFNKIKELHPYKIPELLTIPIIYSEHNYLNWMHSNLQY